jgi:hypothetical protein
LGCLRIVQAVRLDLDVGAYFDAVRLPRKRATFSLLAYDAARLVEEHLLRRPMPRLNVPAHRERGALPMPILLPPLWL